MSLKVVESIKSKIPELLGAEIEGLLYLLSNTITPTNEQLTVETGLPVETIRYVRKLLGSESLPTNLKPYSWKSIAFSDPQIEEYLIKIRETKDLKPIRDFDQFFATPPSSITKAKILMSKGYGEEGMNILLLGDDDLVSIALVLLGAKANIYVCDIDQNLLSIIEEEAKKLSVTIKFFLYDARKDPVLHTNFFDCVVTDPPYTVPGVDLFISRSLSFLKDPKKSYTNRLFLFYGNSFKSPEKFLKIQELFGKYRLYLEEKYDKVISYTNADSIGNSSSCYILRVTPFSTPLKDSAKTHIYTFESTKEERFPFVDHIVYRINKVPNSTLLSKNRLMSCLGAFCLEHKLKVLDTKVTSFPKQGMTITYILSNSNLVAHTWPEYNAIHIDLITCTPIYKKESTPVTLSKIFATDYISYSIVS